jgi:ATP-dependent helicase HrpA
MANNRLKKVESLLPRALAADRRRVRREIHDLKRAKRKSLRGDDLEKRVNRLEKKLRDSIKKRARREENKPTFSYIDSLPITAKKDEIIKTITRTPVVIVSGQTGSGKTTQIPKFCLAAGRGIDGQIGCTQPRRIAATMVARRIAEELGQEVGQAVGYKIRFKDRTRRDAYVKIMTDGILLMEAQNDPYLNAYDTIIVDEAHERNLNVDFVLGILKTLLKKRKDLKVIITSATIDTRKFSQAFNDAPIIEVSGRMYPVEVRYLPDKPEAKIMTTDEYGEQTHIESAVQTIDHLFKKRTRGDILVFMPTEQDIRETCEIIEGRNYPRTTVHPLFARLSAADQSKVFARPAGRKIIVATNVAETSLTIPGIRYVIDTGLARISQYNPRSRTKALPVMPISRSSADQRKGRCGRVENGVCIRLFAEEDYQTRELFTPPEILRSNLAEVILRMIALNLGDISAFPFIDRPAAKNIQDGFNLLKELGAITESAKAGSRSASRYSLTARGRLMAAIPLDPRLSRMLIQAQKEGCLNEIAVIAAALSIQDPRERPAEETDAADRIHAKYYDPSSDFITLLNIWRDFNEIHERVKSGNQMKKYCKAHYLSYKRMREWRDIHFQIGHILEENGFKIDYDATLNPEGKYKAIHKSILSGFLSSIAVKKEKNIFQAAAGKQVMIFPGSGLFNRAKAWIVAAEMVETSRLFARTVANIDSNWLEEPGKGLCRYTYLDPHWEKIQGQVVASEQVSLFGLIIVSGRTVSYGRINPEEASDIFIQQALIPGDVEQPLSFLKHNLKLVDEVRNMEDRLRRRDLLVSEEEIFRFYKQRIGGIYNFRSLHKVLEKEGNDRFLRMTRDDLLNYAPAEELLAQFPDRIDLGKNAFACSYRFEPGSQADGITVKIPSTVAPLVPAEAVDWLVPGLYPEKLGALIKGLPKKYRKKLVPVAETVDLIVKQMPQGQGNLITTLGNFIYKHFGLDIPATAWPLNTLPDHLRMRLAITGPNGEELRCSRDKAVLALKAPGDASPHELETARKTWERKNIRRWDFGDLPDHITIRVEKAAKWTVYPGLQVHDQDDKCVNLRLFEHRDEALESHKKGIARLYTIYLARDLKFLKKNLRLGQAQKDASRYFGGVRKLETRLFNRLVDELFYRNIRTQKEFNATLASVSPVILEHGRQVLDLVVPVLEAFQETKSILDNLEMANKANPIIIQFLTELKEWLSRLVPQNFVELYQPEQMTQLPRYIKALAIRAERACVNLEKDKIKAEEIKIFSDSLDELLKSISISTTDEKKKAIEEFFWWLEELKVSVFAQELKTAIPMSRKRLKKKLEEIKRME